MGMVTRDLLAGWKGPVNGDSGEGPVNRSVGSTKCLCGTGSRLFCDSATFTAAVASMTSVCLIEVSEDVIKYWNTDPYGIG